MKASASGRSEKLLPRGVEENHGKMAYNLKERIEESWQGNIHRQPTGFWTAIISTDMKTCCLLFYSSNTGVHKLLHCLKIWLQLQIQLSKNPFSCILIYRVTLWD